MKIAVITQDYPSKENIYQSSYIHTRVKEYLSYEEINLDVFSLTNDKAYMYNYEGVNVFCDNLENIFKKANEYDKIFIHFIDHKLIRKLYKMDQFSGKIIVYFHGVECLSFRHRIMNLFSEGIFDFIKYILWNYKQRIIFNIYLRKIEKKFTIDFVFPSMWLKKNAEKDLLYQFKNYKIIPNPVNNKIFKYKKKKSELRFKILVISSFDSYVYGTDKLKKLLLDLINHKKFKKYKDKIDIKIIGKGKLFEKHTKGLKKYEFISIENKFISHKKMVKEFWNYGVFINTKRLDTQNVTMCEAMYTGMTVLSLKYAAIPEFISHQYNGLLAEDLNSLIDLLLLIFENPKKFSEISTNAHNSMQNSLKLKNIAKKDLSI